MKNQPRSKRDDTSRATKGNHRRIGIDRREGNHYTDIIPERRSGTDRRKRKEPETSGEGAESDAHSDGRGE